ncbi:MAG: DNA translocase FtsK 4TM domain-containing protein, partial [Sporomusaceae bacterium]|nr:DNA translocase FtsK 4TM domain-containing protein [Sporomusaceae bacterium]
MNFFSGVSSEFKYELWGIFLVALGLISMISLLDLSTGAVGLLTAKVLHYAFGIGALVVPLVIIIIGSRYVWMRRGISFSLKFVALVLLFLFFLALYHHWLTPLNQEIYPESLINGGGLSGGLIVFGLRKLFGFYGTFVLLTAAVIGALMVATNWSLGETLIKAKDKADEGLLQAKESLACALEERRRQQDDEIGDEEPIAKSSNAFYNQEREKKVVKDDFLSHDMQKNSFYDREKPLLEENETAPEDVACLSSAKVGEENKESAELQVPLKAENGETILPYRLPPLSMLKKPVRQKSNKTAKEIMENAHILESTLASFHVSAKITHTCQGPAVTRYELEPAAGVKVSKIVNLADDIALKLAAPGVRIEAPIPGKAAIGIEVPNKEVASVPHREVLESDAFQQAKSYLSVALGKDIAGQTIIADLAKMPHLLVAGATGSGKSVCINTLITSILFKAKPEEAKFILIDPKVVELSNYNGIPHLLTPVVTDAKKAASALRWAVREMERRYALFAAASVRDISRYNEIT